ncbi:MAG: basic amino acid ABC transporter substrate-binding protein [Firmicutes bacterium]|nr:basic amino acid ABC transporter substrate-binding protein [Bacillota bacterium]
MKKFLVLLLALSLVFAMTACGGSSEEAADDSDAAAVESVEGMTFKVATEPTFPPFELVDEETNEITGFDIELIKAIAEDQGFNVEVEQMGFDAIVGAVQTGVTDIGASGMSITEERLETVDFSDPYIDAGLAIAVQESNSDINGEADLQDKTCAVQLGTTGAAKAMELQEAGVLKDVKTFNTVDVVMNELKTGGVDCVINDLPVTQAYIAKMGGIKVVGETLVSDSYGFAVMKGNTALLDAINAGLENVKASGKYDELIAKYFE